jgi:PKD repeat protein
LRPNTGACDPATGSCKTITQAKTAAHNGDTIVIMDGSYAEAPIAFTQKNLTVKAEHPGLARITTSSTTAGDDVLIFGPASASPDGSGDGSTLEGVVVSVPPAGGHAVFVRAQNVTIKGSTLQHLGTSTAADVPVVETDSAITGGITTLLRDLVIQSNGTSGAVVSTSVLAVTESILVASRGPAVVFDGGSDTAGPNSLLRSQALGAGGDGVDVHSGGNPVTLRIDSSFISGSANGLAVSATAFLNAAGENISVTATHATIAGGGKSVAIDATPALLDIFPPGNALVGFNYSIVHGPATAASGAALNGNSSTVGLDIVNSDTDVAPGANITVAGTTNTPDKELFVDVNHLNLHLRGDAPVIDKGADPVAGESQTDVDGGPRVAGVASDWGADEFVNHVPAARITAEPTVVTQNQAITFDGSGSTDPDVGDKIVRYKWDFGDGTTDLTESPRVTHTYTTKGAFSATLRVVDSHIYASELATIAVGVRDSSPPTISIVRPTGNHALSASRSFTLTGAVADESGIGSVRFSLQLQKRAKRHANTSAAKCQFFNGLKVVTKSCGRPIQLMAKVSQTSWRYKIPRSVHLPAGSYVLKVQATDAGGVRSRRATRHFRLG